jgi:DnaK suppressor protein
VSPSAISRAEAGHRGLGLDTVIAIAEAFRVSLDDLLEAASNPGYVLARRDRAVPRRGVTPLLDDPSLGMRAYLVSLGPGEQGEPPAAHKGPELIVVASGLVQIDLGRETPVMGADDAALATTTAVHGWRNLTSGLSRLFWVLRRPHPSRRMTHTTAPLTARRHLSAPPIWSTGHGQPAHTRPARRARVAHTSWRGRMALHASRRTAPLALKRRPSVPPATPARPRRNHDHCPPGRSQSSADQLSPRDIAALVGTLEDELAAQRAHVVELQEKVTELTGQSDPDSLLERELAERSYQRTLEVITAIELAVRRVDGGGFGRCERCGGPIAVERLQAVPFTRHCVGCPPPAPRLSG